MNFSTAIFLINDDVRAIAATYEKVDLTQNTAKMKYQPAYLEESRLPEGAVIFKTMDPDIDVNDYIVVPTDTRHGLTVCQVIATDVEIDPEATAECHWIVGKVDTSEFERLRQQEAAAIQKLKDAKTHARRKKLKAELMGKLDDDQLASIPMLTPPAKEAAEE